jgi:hypothetical protein
MGFYETENLPTFSVKNQQTYLQQTAQNFRQYQCASVGASYPANVVTLPESATSSNSAYQISFEQYLNAGQYNWVTPVYTGAFTNGGSGTLISVSALKRYYFIFTPVGILGADNAEYYTSVQANYGFNNLPKTIIADEDSQTKQIPPYFNLFSLFSPNRGTEIFVYSLESDGTKTPFVLYRNLLDFIGPDGFPGPLSPAYNDPELGTTGVVRFVDINGRRAGYFFPPT